MKLNAKQLRVTRPSPEEFAKIPRKPIYIVLDNVMDTYNIGSIFRLADAFAVQEVVLCAGSETPPSSRIHKAAVGTDEWVPWRYFRTTEEAIRDLKANVPDLHVVAVEQNEKSIPLAKYTVSSHALALVVGHETDGVSAGTLAMTDSIVEMPMYGVNKSLNVVVSTGIVLYTLVK